MQASTKHEYDRALRDVLHVLATQTESEPCISLILQTAVAATGALGAAFRSSGETALDVSIGQPGTLETGALHADSDTTLVYPIGNDDGGVFWLTFESATHLRQAERDLLEALVDGLTILLTRMRTLAQGQRLALALLRSIPDPLLVFDQNWRLLLCNPAASTIFGDRAALGQPLGAVAQSDELVRFTDGAPLAEWTLDEKTYVPHVEPLGSDGWTLALRDITQYQKLNRSQAEFLRIVSHDVRSPLTSVQGFAGMLEMAGELNDKQEHFIEKILSGVSQITALIDNIQDAGRFDPETGFYEMTRSQLDLHVLAQRVVDTHLIPAEKQELTITLNVADDVPIINADANMLERALINLVDNAIKYTPNGSQIDVNVTCASASVIVAVHDNGPGISPEDQKLLFQRHMRLARPEHRRVKGTGLGLFIVRSVARRHGGDAWVDSVPGAGSTFSFSIPLKGANRVIPDAT